MRLSAPETSRGPNHRRSLAPTVAACFGAATVVAHIAPAAVGWRSARCALIPRLAGIGRADHIALTFDDGPDPTSTPRILDALDELAWRATFFCLGSQARLYPQVVAEVANRGHELAVHGESHKSHLLRSAPAVVKDVLAARDLLEGLSGRQLRWFRPPYGAVAAPTLVAARRSGLTLLLWSAWGKDWQAGTSGAQVADEVERTSVGGDTVLLHDSDVTSAPGSWRATVDSLPLLAERWSRRALTVGPLSEHF